MNRLMYFLGIGEHDSLFELLDARFVLAHHTVSALLAVDAGMGRCTIMPCIVPDRSLSATVAGQAQRIGRDCVCHGGYHNTRTGSEISIQHYF